VAVKVFSPKAGIRIPAEILNIQPTTSLIDTKSIFKNILDCINDLKY